jgi:hypothetical protein
MSGEIREIKETLVVSIVRLDPGSAIERVDIIERDGVRYLRFIAKGDGEGESSRPAMDSHQIR